MKEAGAVSYSPGEASGHVVKEEGGAGARSSSLFSSGSSSSGGSSSAPPPSGKKKPAAAARSPPPVALYKLDPAILENIFLYLRISEVVSLSMVCIESRDRSLLELVTMVEGGFSQPVALIGNLYRMPRLHVLDLTGNEIGVEGARALAIAGTNGYCRSLSILNLSQNNLGEEGVRELTISWASGWAASVSSIDLSHNYVGPAGLALIASIMAAGGLPSLQRLDLSCNTTLEAFQAAPFDVGDFGALCRIPSLRLFASGLREEEALQLATALRQTAQVNVLQRLDLSWNHIKAQGFHHLLSAFHHHGRGRSLTHLNLRHNEIDPGDAHPFPGLPNGLATALPNLLELDLAENQIGDRWTGEIGRILREGGWRSIIKIDLSSNAITGTGAADLKAAIASEGSSTLRALALQGNVGISEDLVVEIEALVESVWARAQDRAETPA